MALLFALCVPIVFAAGTHSAGFDLLLIGHVASALVGFGAVGLSALQAARLRRENRDQLSPGIARYFAPGTNWAGRVLYAVPLFGFALVADSGRNISLDEAWIMTGLAVWIASVLMAETVIWPAERRIQGTIAATSATGASGSDWVGLRRDCTVVVVAGALAVVLFLGVTVIMVAQPA